MYVKVLIKYVKVFSFPNVSYTNCEMVSGSYHWYQFITRNVSIPGDLQYVSYAKLLFTHKIQWNIMMKTSFQQTMNTTLPKLKRVFLELIPSSDTVLI